MKIKLDENLPESLLAALLALGHDVDNVRQEGLTGRDDGEVWKAAQENRRFLLTQDLDFSNVHKFQPGTHQGLLLIRLSNAGASALTRRIAEVFSLEDIESMDGMFRRVKRA